MFFLIFFYIRYHLEPLLYTQIIYVALVQIKKKTPQGIISKRTSSLDEEHYIIYFKCIHLSPFL